jgi:hypothetical protein
VKKFSLKGGEWLFKSLFLILHKISPLENALTEMPLRKFVYLYKDLSSTYTVISRIGKFFVS